MGKIAAEVDAALVARAVNGEDGRMRTREIAGAADWAVSDVLCTSAPADRAFEEEHTRVSVALVVAGTFQYRSTLGRYEMTPGSILLGSPGECFECGHDHAPGDRCIAFRFAPEYVERLLPALGRRRAIGRFRVGRVPPTPASSPLMARALAGLVGAVELSWEELALEVAALAFGYGREEAPASSAVSSSAAAYVTESVRRIQRDPAAEFGLGDLAESAGVSPFHYLRTFRKVIGVTPHQFLLRTRLREAASRLMTDDSKVIDIAFASGFGDLSNFNRAFLAEFGLTPRAFRIRHRGPAAARRLERQE